MSNEHDLNNPPESDAPLVALISKSPSEMTDAELSAHITELKQLRTQTSTVKAKVKNTTQRKKSSIDISDLL